MLHSDTLKVIILREEDFVFLPHHIAAGQSHRGITQRGRGTGKRDTHINGYNVRNKMEEMTRVTAEHCNLQLF